MKKILLTMAVVVGFIGLAQASGNRNIAIKMERENANVMAYTAETPNRWQHLNRFARDKEDVSSLGGIDLPSVEQQQLPKNYKNNSSFQ